MLSSISPLGERARHNRWLLTVWSYTAASVAAATAIGWVLGSVGGLMHLPVAVRAAALAAAAGGAAVVDATRTRPPGPRRQVDEDWLGRYRGWVYGAGFGAQLGAGVFTIVTTATVWLCLAAEVASGSAAGGAVVGGAFGLFRAVPVLSAFRVRSYAQLQARHRTLATWAPAAGHVSVTATGVTALGLGALAVVGAS